MSITRRYFGLKTIALLLVIALFAQQFQTLSFASFTEPSEYIPSLSDATDFIPDNTEKPAEDAYILFEDESKRELSSKQFRMSDGTFMAVSYPEQVHFERPDGTFADIDNRLIYNKSNSENDYSGYINRANFFTVKFNETFDTGSSIIYSVTKDDSSIVFSSLNDEHNSKSANATVTQAKDEDKPFETIGDAAGELAFVSSKISYSDTDNKVDHDYVLVGNHINEYIVIKEKLNNYTFTYRIDAENLIAETDDDGCIVFTDGSGETVYSIPAPYMYDDAGIFSNAVSYTLTETDGAYILTVQADENWINEEDRTFPVTIDPDLYVGKYNSSDVEDADVWQGSPTLIQGLYEYMTCGYTDYIDNKDMRMLVKIGTLPTIPAAAVLVDARLNMKQLTKFGDTTRLVFGGSTPIDFAARRITSAWSESTVTWNNKPSVNSTILDYRTASLNTKGKYLAFDITEAAVMWYNGTATNYGVEIRTMESLNEDHFACFCASENPNQYSSVLPMFKFSYRDNKGIEDYWTFHSAGAADAGTVYVNDFSGNPVVTTELFSTPGNILPITVGLVYNGYLAGAHFTSGNAVTSDFSNMKVGAGFKLNVQETVVETTVGDYTYYVHSDSDGTEHYYLNFDNGTTFYSEDGLGFSITKSNGNYYLSDGYGNTKTFNSSGYLIRIEDVNGNAQVYTYTSGKLTKIESTPAGSNSKQTATFTYNSNNCLSYIIQGSDKYTFTYSGTDPYRLTNVSRGTYFNYFWTNAESVSFIYNGDQLSEIISDTTGQTVSISYDSDNRVSALTETANSQTGQTIGFIYSPDKKTVIRTSGLDDIYGNTDDIYTTYVFDYFGRTITAYTKDLDGTVVSASNAAYNTETGKSKAVNGISKSGAVGASSINLLSNSSFENGYTGWSGFAYNGGSYSVVEEQSFYGNKSAKLSVSSTSTGTALYSRQISLVSGKTYTLSAYVKTSNVTGTGAYLYVSGITGAQSIKLTGTTDTSIQNGWQRIYCTFTAPSTQSYYLYLYLSGTSGTAYFDAVQLEEGSVGAYNLIENGAFLNSSSSGWTLTTGTLIGASSYYPYYALHVNGNHNSNVTATQTVQLNMPVNTTYMLSAWAAGNSADTHVAESVTSGSIDLYQKARTFQVKATVYYYTSAGYLASTTTEGIAAFDPDTNQLQYTITPIVPNANAVSGLSKQAYAVIEISYNQNINTAQILNVSLTAEPAQTYTYDSNGNLTGVQNADGDTPEYTFAENGVDLAQIANSDGSNYVIDYDSNHQPVSITDANNVKAEYTYDSRGNISQVVVTPSSGTGSVLTQNGYSGDGRFITTVTDERGKVTTYNYNSANGLLNYVNDANNNQTRYKYNVYKAITDIFADLDKDGTIDSNEAKVSYVYDSHRNLTQIVTRTTTYNLTYDPFGNVSGITVGSSSAPLAGYTYANYNGKLTRTDYANGIYVENVYDSLDRTVQIKYGGTVRYSVSYDKSGSVSSIYDHENEIEYLYEYDRLGRLVRYYEFEDGEIRTVSAEQYDDKGRTSKITYKNDGYTARQTSYNYDNTGRVSSIILPGNEYEYLSYDTFGRQYFRSYYRNTQFVMGVTNGFETNYFNGASHTSSAINSITYNFYKNNTSLQYNYVYDNVGNITSVSAGQTQLAAYTYDELNQLTQEVNNESGRRYVFEYDLGGNITSVKTYNGTVLENTDTYSYTDSNWQDKLTAFNGHTITYDDLGNPLSYYNGSSYTFTWKDGRKLATLSKGSTSVSYKYNSDGIRYEKTVNGVVHKYYLMGSTITAETIIDGNTTTYIEYFYDSTGPYGFSIDGTFYYYVKNLQGDVMQIRDENNNLIASYVYDAWGKVLSVTENTINNIGAKNAIRFKGYYYDTESSLYYLNARYYDPQIKRFISADETLGANSDIFGYNLYAYCGNDPVNRIDPTGEAWWHWALAATAVVALVAASIVTCGGAAAAAATAAAIVTGTCAAGVSTTAVVVTGAAVGAGIMFAGSAVYAVDHSANLKEFADYGEQALINTTVGAGFGAAAGYVNTKLYCFTEGTLVAAELGQVPIEDINVGDLVWATDTDTGKTELKKVVHLFHNETDEWIHIIVDDNEIVCTPGHPFYVHQRGWIEAAQLRAGDRLQKLNGEYVIVEQIQHELLESPERTYNFEVEDYHTYFVGNSGFLVHNICGEKNTPDQQAVIDLAKEHKAGVTRDEADILVEWAKEYGINYHEPMIHHGRGGIWGLVEHIKIFNIHIPIIEIEDTV